MSVSSNTNWQVKVFSWGTYPPLEGSDPDDIDPYFLTGVTSISLQRSKGSPSGTANVVIRGDSSKTPIRIGDWVIIYSIHDIAPNQVATKLNNVYANASPNGVPRFFGQIRSVRSHYQRDEKATLRRSTVVSISEWSSFFSIPVRYDTFSIVQGIHRSDEKGADLGPDPLAQAYATLATQKGSADALQKISNSLWSAFSTVQIILRLIAAISDRYVVDGVGALDINLPDVALRLPVLPASVSRELKIKPDPQNPFSSEMVTVITGVQLGPIHSSGDWNGVFDPGEFSSLPTDTSRINPDPKDRPKTLGLTPMFSQGLSAWSLLQNHGDTDINEIFTDMAYEYSDDGTEILAKPFLWVRDKPFALKTTYAEKDNQGTWTMFDDVPRIYVSEEYIMEADFSVDADNAFNYIRFNFNGQEIGDPIVLKTQSEQVGINNRQAEQKRFGGKELFLNTSWIAGDPGQKAGPLEGISALDSTNTPAWFRKLKDVVDCWYGNLYRTGSGTLMMKDHNVALTIGMNLQFNIGGVLLVGHIESVSMSFHVDSNNHRATDYQVQLSHIVTVNEAGDLDYLPPDDFRSLRNS